jgi:hypothetical protein
VRTWLNDGADRSITQRVAGAAFLIRVASAGMIYLSQILLARWMGSHEFGIYVYVWVLVLLIGDLSDFGLSSAAQRFIPEYRRRDAQRSAARLRLAQPLARLRQRHRHRRDRRFDDPAPAGPYPGRYWCCRCRSPA